MEKDVLIFVPTKSAPWTSASWLTWPLSVKVPWSYGARVAGGVEERFLVVGPTSLFVCTFACK